jgi:hypothetical protein
MGSRLAAVEEHHAEAAASTKAEPPRIDIDGSGAKTSISR